MAKNTKKNTLLKKVKVSIVILAFSNPETVKATMLDVSKLKKDNLVLDCVFVDNGSVHDFEKEFKNYELDGFGYKYIKSSENLGFAGGNNIGIIYALKNNPDYVLMLNDDMVVPPDLLENLTEFLETNKNVGIVSPKIYFAKGYEFHKDRYAEKDLGKVIWYAGGIIDWDNIYTSHRGVDEVDHGQYDTEDKTDIANGACILIRSEVFKKIGFLDNSLFLYWEDADFSRKVINSGFDVYYYPQAFVWHKVSASAGGIGSKSNDYFLTRNRYYFALRYAKLRTKFAVLRDTLKLSLFGRQWQKVGARDALLGKKGIGSWKK